MDIISYIEKNTLEFLNTVSKKERKKIGQFFTPVQVSNYMSKLSKASTSDVNILDAGAGSGILTASLVQHLVIQKKVRINVDLYENNPIILPILIKNMEYIKCKLAKTNTKFSYKIISENFIIHNHLAWTGLDLHEKYDIVISNPPYKKIGKQNVEAQIMNDIVYGQPNIYFLFMAMGSRLLKPKGELIFIVPRSFSSGMYFTKFRKWFLREMKIINLHLFNSRKAVFKNDNILQETIILKAIKQNNEPEYIAVTSSDSASNIDDVNKFTVSYKTCIKDDANSFIYLPTDEEDIAVLKFINNWEYSLLKNGYRMKTGTVVDFRAKEWLEEVESANTMPLIWAYNFNHSKIKFPIKMEGKPQFLFDCKKTTGLSIPVNNYILVKRFTSKEEPRRLQCVMLNKNQFLNYDKISTENHINYITKTKGAISEDELYGLYVILNSTILDKYFRILNGSTQVNSNEINSIPFPSVKDIEEIGKTAQTLGKLDVEQCDYIINQKYKREHNAIAM